MDGYTDMKCQEKFYCIVHNTQQLLLADLALH